MILNTGEIKESMGMEKMLTLLGFGLNRQNRTACPIHGGKDPNFSVKDQYGTCHSQCGGKSWSATDLLMELKGFSYPEALEWMAEQTGVTVQFAEQTDRKEMIEAAREERERKVKLYATNEAALEFYERGQSINLDERYEFDGRDWSGAAVKAFRIFQAPDENALVKQREVSTSNLHEVGLIKYSEDKDTWYDFFRNRIVFPIFTHNGEVAGFSGRKLTTAHAESPKYKNSRESLVYKKRDLLYGVRQNHRSIRQKGALLFEGMADVVTAYDYGINWAVASCGTAVTKNQFQLLSRYTKSLTIVMDGDEAGTKAATKAVEEGIKQGFHTKVMFFSPPTEEDRAEGIERYDPDNFLRKYGKTGFEAVLDEQVEDGLLWRVMLEWDKDDILQQQSAVSLAGRLISMLDNDMQRDHYLRELSTAKYFGRTFKSHLSDAVKEEINNRLLDHNKPDLTVQQKMDIKKYGIYIKNNQYWVSGDEKIAGIPITNFCIIPIMLIVGSTKSERRVEIRNVYNTAFTVNIDSDHFVEVNSFRKEVERRGNYMLLESFRPSHFIKIKRKLYDDTKVCYPITTLGKHKKMDFFAWSNGLILNNRFQSIDQNGLVLFEDKRFYLPAFASVSEDILSDDQDNSYEEQKDFIYVDEVKAPSIKEWTQRMRDVHGDKGMMAVAWFFAAVFRDIIYSKVEFFPHLNCFGAPGTGKSFLGWSLSYLFGKARRPFNLHDGTQVGFFRRMAQVNNGIAWYDEYSNTIDHRRTQGLKNAYDGAGREKGVASTDNRTMTTQVNSALLITGQEMPTQDIALYTRCITMSFPDTQRSPEQRKKGDELMAIQQTGCLSQITSELQQFRKYISDNFDQIFDDYRSNLSEMLQESQVHDRLINNYCIPLTVFWLLAQKLELGFEQKDLLEFAYQNIKWQNESINQEDDLAFWWDTVIYFVEKGELIHNKDLLVQSIDRLTIRKPDGKNTETITLDYEMDKKVLFLSFTKSFRFYKEQIRREGGSSGLNKEAVRYYLKNSPAFMGEIRAKKIGGVAKACFAFDLDKLNFDLPYSNEDNDEDLGRP